MRITIENVDIDAVKHIGYTQLPSYPVQFLSSGGLKGTARFVPFDENVRNCIGESFEVEVNQEKVTDFERVNRENHVDSIIAFSESGAFRIYGTVKSIVPLNEPKGNAIVYVAAGEALLSLNLWMDLHGMKITEGEAVTFVIHEMSLWDEAL